MPVHSLQSVHSAELVRVCSVFYALHSLHSVHSAELVRVCECYNLFSRFIFKKSSVLDIYTLFLYINIFCNVFITKANNNYLLSTVTASVHSGSYLVVKI
jgi:hypothetical protein